MVELTSDPIDVNRILTATDDPTTGGVAVFLGRVRDHAEGRKVRSMEYEAYTEMALLKMQEIADTARARWPVHKLAVVHRTGHLQLGEISVAIAVACAHRKQAFDACRFVIDAIKNNVPIWKKEHFTDGEAWVEGTIPDRTPD